MSILIGIWIVLMVLTGIGKVADHLRKREAVLNREYQGVLHSGPEPRCNWVCARCVTSYTGITVPEIQQHMAAHKK
jgi:hypothetical protein